MTIRTQPSPFRNSEKRKDPYQGLFFRHQSTIGFDVFIALNDVKGLVR